MTNTNVSPRFDGSVELTAADVERLPYVSLLPGDFTDRGRLPLPRPVRKQDTRRTAHPLRRGVPDDLLQGLTGSPRRCACGGGA